MVVVDLRALRDQYCFNHSSHFFISNDEVHQFLDEFPLFTPTFSYISLTFMHRLPPLPATPSPT